MSRIALLALLLSSARATMAFVGGPRRAIVPHHVHFSAAVPAPADSSLSQSNGGNSTSSIGSDDEHAAPLGTVAQLSPEYQAVTQKAIAAIKASIDEKHKSWEAPLVHFCKEYMAASQASHEKTGDDVTKPESALKRMMEGVQFGFQFGMGPERYTFGVTHKALRGTDPQAEAGNTIDYYAWGCDFFRPFMDIDKSVVMGEDNLREAVAKAEQGENVVLFANHQSEADPQVVSCMLEKSGLGEVAAKITFVAGHKVTTDPLAIPFSMGRNLICIHSKKHIDADPETKPFKSRQNLAAMNAMLNMLKAGGCILWIAPSGGRDRRDLESGKMPISPFDSKTIDMFRLMGNKSKVKTNYYSFAMTSYELCPPPDFVEAGVGEKRNFRFVPVGIYVGKELESVGGLESRQAFNKHTFDQTLRDYIQLREAIFPGTAPDMPDVEKEQEN